MIHTTVTTPPREEHAPPTVELALLRALATLHIATTDHLSRMLWNTPLSANRLRRLDGLIRRMRGVGLVWRSGRRMSPGFRNHQTGAGALGWVYGLTPLGRSVALQHMPDLAAVNTITHEGWLMEGERHTLLHSLHATEWCVQLIERLRLSPHTAGVYISLESTVLGAHLRMDGLIRIRMQRLPRVPGEERPPWWVPWLPTLRTPLPDGCVDATFALEIDQGTEQLAVLEGKALNYRRTYLGAAVRPGMATTVPFVDWPAVLCPEGTPNDLAIQQQWFPTPVLVLTSATRLRNVAEVWMRGWPSGVVRFTTWEQITTAGSVIRAPHLDEHGQWVDVLGHALAPNQEAV